MKNLAALIALALIFSLNAPADLLAAGVAKTDVTPPTGGLMYGYGARGDNVSEGVHDPLYAKVLVLVKDDVRIAVVTLDLGAVYRENYENILKHLDGKTKIDKVLLIASHTHSAPRPTDDFPSKQKPWIREAERKIANAILEAEEKLQLVTLSVGWGEVREGHNRRLVNEDGSVTMFWENRERVPTEPVDYSLAVIRVDNAGGEPVATLVNFACHPVVLGPENLLISADYPGAMMAEVEGALGGQCMFVQGAAGDINPFWDKTPPEEGAYEQMTKMGKTVAKEVIRVAGETTAVDPDAPIRFKSETVLFASRRDRERAERDIPAEITSVLIGDDLALATFPGEFFVEHGLALKTRSPYKNTLFAGYGNDQLAYFPTIKACTEGGYGAASATRVEVGAGERLVNRALVNLLYLGERIEP